MKRVAVILGAFFALTFGASGSALAGGSKPPPTKYPIVLCHGLGGFDEMFGVLDYFWGIKSDLSGQGYKVFATEVPSFNSIQVRGDILADQIEDIIAITGKPKVNLLGHSMGGLDIRYAAKVLGSTKVASVTSMATPHRGAVGADFALLLINNLNPGGITTALLNALADLFGGVVTNNNLSLPQDAMAALTNLSSAYLASWNQQFTNVPGIYYQSWSGASVFNVSLDPTDALLAATSILFGFEPNDGLVGVNSAGWGTIRNLKLNANHLDEVNHLFGSTGLFGFDAKGFYRSYASDLQKKGY
ncbi:MAG: triacylglycerol lipase [Bdellovibrionota bacterium]